MAQMVAGGASSGEGKRLNDDIVKGLPRPTKGSAISYYSGCTLQGVTAPRGFGVRVTATGARSFVLNYRLRGREHRFTIGSYPDWTVIAAIREARELRRLIDRGLNPLEARAVPEVAKTVDHVLDEFVARYVRNKASPLRSADTIESAFRRLVKPRIGKTGIYELRRSQIVEMLDDIEDEIGAVTADRVLSYVREALNWYAIRDDRFYSPIVRGMARTKPKERARTRVLSDTELRIIWPVLGQAGTFGSMLKELLFSAQRRGDVAGMRRSEIDSNGIWAIPAERYKTKRPHFVPLSKAALKLALEQPTVAAGDFVFGSGVGTAFSAFGKCKVALDNAVHAAMRQRAAEEGLNPEKVQPIAAWGLHDLRRTAKTLMARAGVRPDISERVLGHVIPGVEGVYDRHSYADEKRDALERLATIVERIVNPLPLNVQSLDRYPAAAVDPGPAPEKVRA